MNKYYLCKTQEEYDWLMKKLEKKGFKWFDSRKPTKKHIFNDYKENTVIEITEENKIIYYSRVDYYLTEQGKGPADFILVAELMKEERRHNEDNFNALDPCRILIKQPTESEEPLVVPLPFKPAPILNRYQVEGIARDLEEKQSQETVYLVQRKVSKAESESVVDKLFRTFQAAERYVLGQGAKPSGYYCYEDDVYKYEIDQMIIEVEE